MEPSCLLTHGPVHRLFIGLCAKRSSNLIAAQRISTCDSRYRQTLDGYLDKLSDSDSLGGYRQLLHYVCFSGWWASRFDRLTVQKLSAGLGSVALTDRLPAARASTPQHSRCPLATLSRAVGLISHSSLITWNQTLKEGGSHYMGLLIKSEKYGRQMEIKSER